MPLQSKLFRGDAKLEACLVSDPAHIQQGAAGPHVGKIQSALVLVAKSDIDGGEVKAARYGPSTAAAVLGFKTKRGIINTAYQTKPDAIVGKMTIAALDKEVKSREAPPLDSSCCALYYACPPDAGGSPPLSNRMGLVTLGTPIGPPSEADIMAEALRESRASLWDARGDVMSVANTLRANLPLVPVQEKTFTAAIKWLNLNRADLPACITHMDAAAALMLKNFNVVSVLSHAVGELYHALSYGNRPDLGLHCGDPFFNHDGPNCRRDVVTHEFFHMIGIGHGGGAGMAPTLRSAITTPAQALDSADNLAQLVAQLRTFKTPNTDACVRRND